jgi:hypothetical protein
MGDPVRREKGLMEAERRAYPRMLANWRASLVIDNREVSTNLRNISDAGAYLRVREQDAQRIAASDVGRPVLLRMEQDGDLVSRRGEIMRYIEDCGSFYVAVKFTVEPKAAR